MENRNKILADAINLIRGGKYEDAGRIVVNELENEIVNYLKSRFRWSTTEARDIFYDAYLMVQDKIIQGDITELNKTYFIQSCIYIGANQYRKCLKDKEHWKKYVEESIHEYNHEVNDYVGIEIYDENEMETMSHQFSVALRAFSMLNDRCKKMLELKYIHRLSHSDIIQNVAEVNTERSSITILSRCVQKWKQFVSKI